MEISTKGLTREMLEKEHCSEPGCDCADREVFFYPRCHDAPLRAFYSKEIRNAVPYLR
jgi:hypothetical protein